MILIPRWSLMLGASWVSCHVVYRIFTDTPPKVEFGAPKALLQNEKGVLRALVDDSGDKENLYAMVAKE